MSDLIIGIDGGGTRTRARLANTRSETLGNGRGGPANPNAHGLPAAQNEILTAIQLAFDDAQIERQRVAAACLGIGGVDRAEERALFIAWARAMIAERVAVVNDGEIVLAAGTPNNWGIALVAGTGSIAWGKSRVADPPADSAGPGGATPSGDGRMARAGGWGYLIGDEGSGFDLAREALRAATRAADGRGDDTRLLRAILDYWGLREAPELIPRLYRSEFKPADLAQLASVVVRVAAEGDPIAQKLIDGAGTALADAVVAVAHALGIEEEAIPLALSGGLLLGAESVRERLLTELKSHGCILASVTLVHEPVVGAVRIAQKLAEE